MKDITQQFNELEYRQQIIVKGVDPAQAFDLARRTADAQGLQTAQSVSHAKGPAKHEATKKAPAKRRSKTNTKKADEKPRKAPTKAKIALIDASAQIMETPRPQATT